MKFGAAVLATWRISHLLAKEDGPADVIARAREQLGDSEFGALMDCFQCTSLWVAAPFAFYAARKPVDRVVVWLALSAGACVLDAFVSDEESEGGSDGLLREPQAVKQRMVSPAARPTPLPR